MNSFSIQGNIADIRHERVFSGSITVMNKRITSIQKISDKTDPSLPFILPGFIDSHVHIESSMLVPAEFARLAVIHGTVSTVSDPHEIANVCGMDGVQFMIDNGNSVNFKFYFGAPSCVPATIFETAGAFIGPDNIQELLERNEIKYLSEMMNFPGVINGDSEVLRKIKAARTLGKPVDGHAPGLRGEALNKYAAAGISTDHECFTREEALEKLSLGMKILIREGSAAKNFDALIDLLHDYPDHIMFCSDDKHPDSLVQGHINTLCRRAVEKGINIFNVLKAACLNPVIHYALDTGTLLENDPADFIVVKDLRSFEVIKTFINGTCVAENGITRISSSAVKPVNNFRAKAIKSADLLCKPSEYLINNTLPVIEALDGQLITNKISADPKIENGFVVSDIINDVLKLVVVNRYENAPPAISFIRNFGFRKGSIASSVAHDSHNVIAVGTDDQSLLEAINLVMTNRGGISGVSNEVKQVLALPVGGLMSAADGFKVASLYTEMDKLAKSMGSPLSAPYMTLSFMALLVIPSLKLSDKGLFDGERFEFVYRQ